VLFKKLNAIRSKGNAALEPWPEQRQSRKVPVEGEMEAKYAVLVRKDLRSDDDRQNSKAGKR
jgi:hypothetical protein